MVLALQSIPCNTWGWSGVGAELQFDHILFGIHGSKLAGSNWFTIPSKSASIVFESCRSRLSGNTPDIVSLLAVSVSLIFEIPSLSLSVLHTDEKL